MTDRNRKKTQAPIDDFSKVMIKSHYAQRADEGFEVTETEQGTIRVTRKNPVFEARPVPEQKPVVSPRPEDIPPRISELIAREQGIFLDLGCGGHKEPRAIGMDKRDVPGVDIVHDIETFPWPLPDAVCYRILASHLFEHLKPWLMIDIMNECHRIMKPNGQLMIAMPYPGTPRFYQDPTHIKAWNEATPHYFNCEHPLWTIYQPKCWKIELNQWNSSGDINIVMAARPGPHEEHGKEPND